MKTFFDVLKISFLTLGSIIGAGFITGRELISFFGADGFYPFMAFSAVLFFLSFSLVFFLGRLYGGHTALNSAVFACPKAVDILLLISSFFSLSAVLSALDTLFPVAGLPILSAFCLITGCVFLGRGVGVLEKISLVLVPPVIIAVLVATLNKGGLDFGAFYSGGFAVKSVKAFLYVFMNIFINLPVISACAYGKSKKSLFISAFVVSALLFFVGLTVSATIRYAGESAQNSPMPLTVALKGDKLYPLIALTLLFSLLSSAFTAFYPLYRFARERAGLFGALAVATACYLFSMLGVKNIVDYAYPISGAFGGAYLIRCLIFCLKRRKGIKGKKRRIIGVRR